MKEWAYLLIALGILLFLLDPLRQGWLVYGS